MGLRKHFTCDLCGSQIDQHGGVGVYHQADRQIRAIYLHNESAGHHLCNECVRGLRGMLADLDRTAAIHDELDRAEAEPAEPQSGNARQLGTPKAYRDEQK
jgi:hypothetical protein